MRGLAVEMGASSIRLPDHQFAQDAAGGGSVSFDREVPSGGEVSPGGGNAITRSTAVGGCVLAGGDSTGSVCIVEGGCAASDDSPFTGSGASAAFGNGIALPFWCGCLAWACPFPGG